MRKVRLTAPDGVTICEDDRLERVKTMQYARNTVLTFTIPPLWLPIGCAQCVGHAASGPLFLRQTRVAPVSRASFTRRKTPAPPRGVLRRAHLLHKQRQPLLSPPAAAARPRPAVVIFLFLRIAGLSRALPPRGPFATSLGTASFNRPLDACSASRIKKAPKASAMFQFIDSHAALCASLAPCPFPHPPSCCPFTSIMSGRGAVACLLQG